MRTISILIVTFFLSAIAYAQDQPSAASTAPSQRQCVQLGAVYEATASVRNQGLTPKEALSYVSSLYPTKHDIANKRLVLMPPKLNVEDNKLKKDIEGILIEGLKQKYEVYSGVSVAKRIQEISLKIPRINGEPDQIQMMQAIGKSFHSDLIAEADISKEVDGYFYSLGIENISNNDIVFGQALGCNNCDADQVEKNIKLMVSEASQDKKDAENLQLSEKRVKQIINSVYFDPAFRGAGGTALQMQIYQICMGTYKPMEPLK